MSGRFAELEDALCDRVLELRGDRPLAPLTIVVGSTAVRTRVGDLLVRRLVAVANVRIVTLARFAADLVAEDRGAPPVVLTGMARERLVRCVVDEARERGLVYFGPVCERPHFARALADTFADLREATVDPATDWAAVAVGEATRSARARAADLRAMYGAYCDALRHRGLLDGAGVHLQAAAQARGGALGASILYGVYDLNQAQEALVAELLRGGADLFVPLAGGAFDALATSRGVALAAGMSERRLEVSPGADDAGRAAAAWSTRGETGRGPLVLRGDGSLRVVSVTDERTEAREAVRAVLEAAESGAALRDCAVVAPGADDVELQATALRAAGLAVACRRPDRSVGPRLLLRVADCLSPVAGAPFARRAVVDLLTAACLRDSDASPDEMALWLDEARQAGVIAGLEQWVERIGRRRRGLERRALDLEERTSTADGAAAVAAGGEEDVVADKLAHTRRRLGAATGLEAAVTALARVCAALPARASWGIWARALSAAVAALFTGPESEAASDVAARLAALDVVGEEVDATEVAGVLREQLAGARVPFGRVGRDGVAVLTPLELRGLRFHTVVFTGLAEGGFPVRGRPDPILGDAERRRLTEAYGVRVPLAESRDAESGLLFALACGAARERLVLLAPRTEAASGRPRLPSRVLLWLASRAAGRPVGLDEFLGGAPLGPVWRRVGGAPRHGLAGASPGREATMVWADARERDAAVLLSLSESGGRAAAQDYFTAILSSGGTSGRRFAMWRAARDPEPGPWDGLLGGEARGTLLRRSPFAAEMPPTRLERYVACPFAFLLRDVLRLEAPEEPAEGIDMDALEFGSLAHGVLQRTYEAVIADGLGLDDALASLASAWEAGCTEAERMGVTGAALAWGARRAALHDDLRESLRRDPVFARDGGRPVQVEWPFGEAVGRAVSLDLGNGRSVRFSGRLDRVDETPRGARVIDYKTGKGATERQRLKDRLSVQLPVYQLALRQAGDGSPDEIECVYRLVTRRGGFEDLPLPDAEPEAAALLRALVGEALALFEDGVLARSTAGRCEYCDVAYACGASSWTRARKRRHAALARLVALQSSGPLEVADAAGA